MCSCFIITTRTEGCGKVMLYTWLSVHGRGGGKGTRPTCPWSLVPGPFRGGARGYSCSSHDQTMYLASCEGVGVDLTGVHPSLSLARTRTGTCAPPVPPPPPGPGQVYDPSHSPSTARHGQNIARAVCLLHFHTGGLSCIEVDLQPFWIARVHLLIVIVINGKKRVTDQPLKMIGKISQNAATECQSTLFRQIWGSKTILFQNLIHKILIDNEIFLFCVFAGYSKLKTYQTSERGTFYMVLNNGGNFARQ